MQEEFTFRTDKAFARATDPLTSHEAAESVTTIRDNQKAVLRMFDMRGPMTHEQLVDYYNGPPQSSSGLRTRCRELVRMGLVKDTGRRDILKSGRRAIIWDSV